MDNPKNILFVMNHYPDSRNGGIENVTRLLSCIFTELGHKVHIRYLYRTNFDHSDDSVFASCEYLEWDNLENEIKRIVRKSHIDVIVNRCVIIATPILRKAISESGCKLITTYNNKPTLAARRVKEIWGDSTICILKKLVILMSYPVYKQRSIKRLRESHRNSYQSSDALVLLSNQYTNEYVNLYNVDCEKITIINNPIKSGLGITKTEFENKEKIVLIVTRLDDEQKCVIKALKLWKSVSTNIPDWKLVIIGSGPDEDKIKNYNYVEKLSNIEFIRATDPTEYYKRSSIFLMTSRNEGWPNTLNEAMRYGCVPIVLATFSAIYDIIDNDINGYIVEPNSYGNDLKNMQNIIINLTDNPDTMKSLALAAIEKTHRLSIENIIPQWLHIFNN